MGGLHAQTSTGGRFRHCARLDAGAQAQDLKFPKGEGAFSWASLDEFAAAHTGLEGQTLIVLEPVV